MLDEDDGLINSKYQIQKQEQQKHHIFTITLNTCVHKNIKRYLNMCVHKGGKYRTYYIKLKIQNNLYNNYAF